jgi:hypothetical protein
MQIICIIKLRFYETTVLVILSMKNSAMLVEDLPLSNLFWRLMEGQAEAPPCPT